MYAVTRRFLEEVRGSHRAASWVEVLHSGVAVATLAPTTGTVEVNGSNAIRRRFTGTLVDPDGDLTPAEAQDLLMPFGTELRAWRGVIYADGTTEAASLGVFRLTDTDVQHDAERGVRLELTAYDRAQRIQRPLTRPVSFTAGTVLEDAIRILLETRWPGIPTRFPPTGWTTPTLLFDTQEDPWRRAQELAASAGYDLYFDADGVCIMAPVPTAAAQHEPVWQYAPGEAQVLASVGRRFSSDNVPNGVIVTGTNSGLASSVRGEAWDNDPRSVTYRHGPYGENPKFVRSPYARSNAQAQTQATADLNRGLGIAQDLRFAGVVNPAHDAGDRLLIEDPTARIGEVYIIDRLTIPLAVTDNMDGNARSLPSLESLSA